MATDVTITGGSNHSNYDIGYNTADRAYVAAQALATAINSANSSIPTTVYHGPVGTPGGLAIDPNTNSGSANLRGFSAIAAQDTTHTQNILGGGVANQSVVAGVGGLTFYAIQSAGEDLSNIALAALGGNNYISLNRNSGSDVVTLSNGNDTILAGDGAETISAGGGNNVINAINGGGSMVVSVGGNDSITLGAGFDTISVDPAAVGAHAYIDGTQAFTNPTSPGSYSLVFKNGSVASTVIGSVDSDGNVSPGNGSYSIDGGTGGGDYTGGSDGNNYIAGTGAMSILGGGAGDTLVGGNVGSNVIAEGDGNSTLMAGSGNTTLVGYEAEDGSTDNVTALFDLSKIGHGLTDHVMNYLSADTIDIGSYTVSSYAIHQGSGTITLSDNTTKIVLDGYRGGFSTLDITH